MEAHLVPSAAWKDIERAVAVLTDGVRSWDTPDDIDVITVSDWKGVNPLRPDGELWSGSELAGFARAGLIDAWAIEVKNHGKVTLAMQEAWLRHNEQKAAAVGMKSGLVVKRRGGRGVRSPFVFLTTLAYPTSVPNDSDSEGHE